MVPPSPKRPEIQKPSKQRAGRRPLSRNTSVIREQNEGKFIFIAASNQEEERNEVDVELALLNHAASMSTIAVSENGNSETEVVEDIEVMAATSRRSSLIHAPLASSLSIDNTGNVGDDDMVTDDMNNQDQRKLPDLEIPQSSPPKSGSRMSEKQSAISLSPSPKKSLSSPSSPPLSPTYAGNKRRSLILHGESFIDQLQQQAHERDEMESATGKKDDVDTDSSDDSDDNEKDEHSAMPLTLRTAFKNIVMEKKQSSGINTPNSIVEEVVPDNIAAAVSRTLKSLKGGIGVNGMDIPETDSPLPLDEEIAGNRALEGENDQPDGKPKRKRTISFHASTGGGGSRRGSMTDPLTSSGRRQSRSRNSSTDHRRSSKDQLRASVIERMNNIAADTVSRSRRSSMQALLVLTAATT